MATFMLSLCLGGLGIIGTAILATSAAIILWQYRDTRQWNFRRHWRTWRLIQVSAIATFFFLAMTASYGILGEPWTWIYLLIACKTGTWWLRLAVSR